MHVQLCQVITYLVLCDIVDYSIPLFLLKRGWVWEVTFGKVVQTLNASQKQQLIRFGLNDKIRTPSSGVAKENN